MEKTIAQKVADVISTKNNIAFLNDDSLDIWLRVNRFITLLKENELSLIDYKSKGIK